MDTTGDSGFEWSSSGLMRVIENSELWCLFQIYPCAGTIRGVQIIRLFWTIVIGLFAGHSAWAQSIAGDWQGTIGDSGKFRVGR
jgi:hypothetical protein